MNDGGYRRRRILQSVCIGVFCGLFVVPIAHAAPPLPSKAEAVRTAEKPAPAQETPHTEDAWRAQLQDAKGNWRSVEITYVPSFSPHPRIVYRWSVRGTWVMASRTATWPPPIPDTQTSELLSAETQTALESQWDAALGALTPVACTTRDGLRRGEIFVEIDVLDTGETHCAKGAEAADTGKLPEALYAMTQQTPRGARADRWTHPFWLVEGSARLRLELQGTAELSIDGEPYGRVNGVLALRLPVGERVLTLRPIDADETRDVRVFLRKDETTIVRVSVEDDAMRVVPSWSQPNLD